MTKPVKTPSVPEIRCSHARLVATEKLKPNPANPNTHAPAQLALYAKVLRHQGWRRAIVVSKESGFIVTGHGAWLTAKAEGWPTCPVDFQSFKSRADETAHMIADNKLPQLAEFDEEALAKAIREELDGFDLDLTGLSLEELQELKVVAEPEEEKPIDTSAANLKKLQKKWKTALGQLWELGEHRMLCGDSTRAEDIQAVIAKEAPSAVLTDPPYGQSQDGVPGDEPENLAAVTGVAGNLRFPNAIFVAFQSPRTFPAWLRACEDCGHKFERMLWLYKAAQCSKPWRGWILKSESILVTSTGKPKWFERKPYSHDCYMLPEVSGELNGDLGWHGSVKPMSVVSDLLNRISEEGAAVCDPFLGSGTTLIACENLKRRCRGIEISPAYVAVILERWATHTGKTPKLLSK